MDERPRIKDDHEPDRTILRTALDKAFPNDAADIEPRARWNQLLGCWMVSTYGMQVGIERDGYVHS